MSNFARFLAVATPVGFLAYIVGWWRGYCSAIEEGGDE